MCWIECGVVVFDCNYVFDDDEIVVGWMFVCCVWFVSDVLCVVFFD